MILLFNKPMNVLSQFTDEGRWRGLKHFIDQPGVYAAGRLDRDSEGLLVLTDDGRLQARITSPKAKLAKTYLVQVEGTPEDAALGALRAGVDLKDGRTRPVDVARIEAPSIWERDPPIRVRKSIPDCWLRLTLKEGKNRQIRRMTAHIGHPTLRIVRWAIGPWEIGRLEPGQWIKTDTRL
ncbi:MAG: pseudouridine synthase [Pseudomonadota bacterium]